MSRGAGPVGPQEGAGAPQRVTLESLRATQKVSSGPELRAALAGSKKKGFFIWLFSIFGFFKDSGERKTYRDKLVQEYRGDQSPTAQKDFSDHLKSFSLVELNQFDLGMQTAQAVKAKCAEGLQHDEAAFMRSWMATLADKTPEEAQSFITEFNAAVQDLPDGQAGVPIQEMMDRTASFSHRLDLLEQLAPQLLGSVERALGPLPEVARAGFIEAWKDIAEELSTNKLNDLIEEFRGFTGTVQELIDRRPTYIADTSSQEYVDLTRQVAKITEFGADCYNRLHPYMSVMQDFAVPVSGNLFANNIKSMFTNREEGLRTLTQRSGGEEGALAVYHSQTPPIQLPDLEEEKMVNLHEMTTDVNITLTPTMETRTVRIPLPFDEGRLTVKKARDYLNALYTFIEQPSRFRQAARPLKLTPTDRLQLEQRFAAFQEECHNALAAAFDSLRSPPPKPDHLELTKMASEQNIYLLENGRLSLVPGVEREEETKMATLGLTDVQRTQINRTLRAGGSAKSQIPTGGRQVAELTIIPQSVGKNRTSVTMRLVEGTTTVQRTFTYDFPISKIGLYPEIQVFERDVLLLKGELYAKTLP